MRLLTSEPMSPLSGVRVFVVAAIFLWTSLCTAQQATITLSPSAQKIRQKVRALSAGAEVTLLMKRRPEYHGDLISAGDLNLLLYEVDEKRKIEVSYEDIKKVRRGYGGYNTISGHHVDLVRRRIAVIALGAVLVAIGVAVAATKD